MYSNAFSYSYYLESLILKQTLQHNTNINTER